MIRKVLSFAIFLPMAAPVVAAQADVGELHDLTVQQLCEQRADPEAWDELERRRVFSQRDLRSIEHERIRPRITEEALLCFMGEPVRVVAAGFNHVAEPLDDYYFLRDGAEVVVRVRQGLNEATVVEERTAN
jgi:hypothetical protein